MNLVKLECQFGDYLVVPDHVSYIQITGPSVSKIGFIGGNEINTIKGRPEEIAAILKGEAPASSTPATIRQ